MANKQNATEIERKKRAWKQFAEGQAMVSSHPVFAPLFRHADLSEDNGVYRQCPRDGYAVVSGKGGVFVNSEKLLDADKWAHAIAQCLLHLGMDHFREKEHPRLWNLACDAFAVRFLQTMRLGKPLVDLPPDWYFSAADEQALYACLVRDGVPNDLKGLTTGGLKGIDMIAAKETKVRHYLPYGKANWPQLFARGVAEGVRQAVDVAAGVIPVLGKESHTMTNARLAKEWFVSSYPLLGALAAHFKLIEDTKLCQKDQISVAAVHAQLQEIYINPAAGLSEMECRFVMAHEMLHVGLRHDARSQGRDHYLWNIACDFVINDWLVEMGIGEMPRFGLLYDPELKGLSAESIYDRIASDMRRFRKIATLRGVGLGDILQPERAAWFSHGEGINLDGFYRNALVGGLEYHTREGRGLLPAGLVEEIRAMAQPPIDWDVELARWFDAHFDPLEKRRTYARISRRQSASPDIPRPHWSAISGADDGRTFGVVLDTSGSMQRSTLAKALGAIASYAVAHEVPAARLICCDAQAHDLGYVPPDTIADRIQLKGRGGTVLQPAIDMLDRAKDFPMDGPLLIITDGLCDRLSVPRRSHAYLVPVGARLPFVPRGPVFYFANE